jgi:hypothetical protein
MEESSVNPTSSVESLNTMEQNQVIPLYPA